MIGVGLNATVLSYMDQIDVGFHCDGDLVEDRWDLIAGLQPFLVDAMKASALTRWP